MTPTFFSSYASASGIPLFLTKSDCKKVDHNRGQHLSLHSNVLTGSMETSLLEGIVEIGGNLATCSARDSKLSPERTTFWYLPLHQAKINK